MELSLSKRRIRAVTRFFVKFGRGKILLLDKVRTDLLLGSFFILDRFVSIERDYKFSFILI